MYNWRGQRNERASYNGSIEASQASDVGSIPIARSRFLPEILYTPCMKNRTWSCHTLLFSICLLSSHSAQEAPHTTQLPNGKLLSEAPGHPRQTNSLPTAVAVSPDGRYAVLLHSGFGSYSSDQKQSLSVLNLETDELTDFPDNRLAHNARQTYFIGLAFSLDSKRIFASMASLTDPLGKEKGS